MSDVLRQITAPTGYGGVIGFCGQVAEGGFVLGGGFGLQSRLHGLGLDNVLSLQVVLPDGRLVTANATNRHADLFWALRGAGGGSFGVVTSLEYRVYPVSDVFYYIGLRLPDAHDMAEVLYNLGALNAPGNLVAMFDGVGTMFFLWTGRDAADMESGDGHFADLVRSVLPAAVVAAESQNLTAVSGSWVRAFGGGDDTAATEANAWGNAVWAAACWTGFLLPANNTIDVWRDVMEIMAAGFAESPHLLPDIELWGGAIATAATSTGTAFPYRSAVYNVGVLLMVKPDEPDAQGVFERESANVDRWWPRVEQYLVGSYVNYPSVRLLQHDDPQHYAKVYWGENLPRLVRVKQRYDPDDVFHFPMSVPVSLV